MWLSHFTCSAHSQHATWAYRCNIWIGILKIHPAAVSTSLVIAKCVLETNRPIILGIYAKYFMWISMGCMFIYWHIWCMCIIDSTLYKVVVQIHINTQIKDGDCYRLNLAMPNKPKVGMVDSLLLHLQTSCIHFSNKTSD